MVRLLDALAQYHQARSLKQLAQITRLHPSSAYRILASMVDAGLVDRLEPGTYRLGLRLLELGNLVKSRLSVRQEALPFMEELHQALGETVNLSVRQGDEIVYVERIAADKPMMRVVQVIGARAPLHVTAVGKVFLSAEDDRACMDYARRTGLPVFTKNSIGDQKRLRAEIERVRKQGYAFDLEEAEKGVCCIGAGICGPDGSLIAGLSVSAPVERLDKDWAPQVKKIAERISSALGYKTSGQQ